MPSILNFMKRVLDYRSVIGIMVLRTIQSRYIGTFGGLSWVVLQPLLMIGVYWFVFSVGFRVEPPGGIPFIVVFLCGLLPWTIFSETLTANTHTISAHASLIKKMPFPSEILPLMNLVVSLIGHAVMILILLLLLGWIRLPFSFYNFQFFYYLAALFTFTLGLSWFVAALQVFYKDLGQMVAVLLPLWFWATPIVWFSDMLPEKYTFWIRLNPLHYIVDGYKASFLYHRAFWENPLEAVYFWSLSFLLFVLGAAFFKKMKPQFAEVL